MKENSIEEAIERLEYIDRTYSCNDYYSIWDLKCIEIILSDYKRVLKENKELQEDRNKFKKALGKRITYCNELEKDLFENGSNYVILKQKVKDKIEELDKEEKRELKGTKGQDRYFVKQTYQNKRMILQELIKESEE